jgi:hypothetical protein
MTAARLHLGNHGAIDDPRGRTAEQLGRGDDDVGLGAGLGHALLLQLHLLRSQLGGVPVLGLTGSDRDRP